MHTWWWGGGRPPAACGTCRNPVLCDTPACAHMAQRPPTSPASMSKEHAAQCAPRQSIPTDRVCGSQSATPHPSKRQAVR
jgi:hypothetical protein